MADGTKIEWADATLNYVNGCSIESPGCTNCYAMKQAHRFPVRQGLTVKTKGGMVWTGEVRENPRALEQALAWRRGRAIFWNAHGDLFHPSVPDAWIDRQFAVMALTPQHRHMILTKRSARMREYVGSLDGAVIKAFTPPHQHPSLDDRHAAFFAVVAPHSPAEWPLPNVWLGVSVEDQTRADERIPDLLATPAAVRFISAEPLLGLMDLLMIDLAAVEAREEEPSGLETLDALTGLHYDGEGEVPGINGSPDPHIDWVIAGGESGPGARPMHPDWARSLRDQCASAGTPFFFKQWGEWVPQVGAVDGWTIPDNPEISRYDHREWEGDHWGKPYAKGWQDEVEDDTVSRVGKKHAGRLLDGVTHDGFPA